MHRLAVVDESLGQGVVRHVAEDVLAIDHVPHISQPGGEVGQQVVLVGGLDDLRDDLIEEQVTRVVRERGQQDH